MIRNLLYLIIFLVHGCASIERATPPEQPAPRPHSAHSEALLQALLAIGVDYRYGGKSPATGFDCSGLVAHVYQEALGIRLPPSSEAQSRAGVPVSLAELQAGDLVFYDTLRRPYSHVGIYLGDGNFVHAPRPGAKVRVESINNPYWRARFNGARRLDPPLF